MPRSPIWEARRQLSLAETLFKRHEAKFHEYQAEYRSKIETLRGNLEALLQEEATE